MASTVVVLIWYLYAPGAKVINFLWLDGSRCNGQCCSGLDLMHICTWRQSDQLPIARRELV